MRAMVYTLVDWIGLQSMDRKKKRICEFVEHKFTNKKKMTQVSIFMCSERMLLKKTYKGITSTTYDLNLHGMLTNKSYNTY